MKTGRISTAVLVLAALVLSVDAAPAQSPASRLAPEDEREAQANASWPPPRILEIAGLEVGMIVAEIGAGRGRNVVYMADRVGPSGRVYAEDIDSEALQRLSDRCRRVGFANVETILGGFTDPKLPAASLDLVFIIGSYQHFSDAATLMRNTRTALRPQGRVAIADCFSEADGPESVTEKTMLSQMEKTGFVLERTDKTLESNRLRVYVFRMRTDR